MKILELDNELVAACEGLLQATRGYGATLRTRGGGDPYARFTTHRAYEKALRRLTEARVEYIKDARVDGGV